MKSSIVPLIFCILLYTPLFVESQTWFKTAVVAGSQSITSVTELTDGSYITVGTTTNSSGYQYQLLLKWNANGSIIWTKTYEGLSANQDYLYSVQATNDTGFVTAGSVALTLTNYDCAIAKWTSSGSLTWSKVYGGSKTEDCFAIQPTYDGGYIVAGRSDSYGDGSMDVFLLKLASNGSLAWSRAIDAFGNEYARAVVQSLDGNYVVVGGGGVQVFLAKVNPTGSIVWVKEFGGTHSDFGYSVQVTSDGGLVVAGISLSFGVRGYYNIMLSKLYANGTLTWTSIWPSSAYSNSVQDVKQTTDGDFLVVGSTYMFGNSDLDIWFGKFSSNGTLVWLKTISGTTIDNGGGLLLASDGTTVLAGYNGDVLLSKWDINTTISSPCVTQVANVSITAAPTMVTPTISVNSSFTVGASAPAMNLNSFSWTSSDYCLPSPSSSPTPSTTPSPSGSPSNTPTPSTSPSSTPTPSQTPSKTPSPSVTSSPSTTPSASVSSTPTSSVTPSASVTPSVIATPSPSTSGSPTPSVTPTISPGSSTSTYVVPSPSASTSDSKDSSDNTDLVIVIPVVIGGVVLLGGATAAAVYVYNKKRKGPSHNTPDDL